MDRISSQMNRKEFVTRGTGWIMAGALAIGGSRALAGELPVVLITGTTSGFGRGMALTFARAGYRTYASMRELSGRNAPKAASLNQQAAAENLPLTIIELDVTSSNSARAAVDTIVAAEGRIDVLVNNAGIFLYTPMELVTHEMWELQMRTNAFGPMELTGLVVPHMRYRGTGLVIQVSSFLGRVTVPGVSLYASSKIALEAASETLHYETTPDGVDIAIIEPTAFDTDINRNARRYFREVSLPSIVRERRWGSEHHRQFLEQLDRNFSGQPTSNPQEVADLAVRIAGTRREERVLRYPVGDQDTTILRDFNTFTSTQQRRVLNNSGYGHLYRN